MVRANGTPSISLPAGWMFDSLQKVRARPSAVASFSKSADYFLMSFIHPCFAEPFIPPNSHWIWPIVIGSQCADLGASTNAITVRCKVKIRKRRWRNMARNSSNCGAAHLMFHHHRLTITISIRSSAILVMQNLEMSYLRPNVLRMSSFA